MTATVLFASVAGAQSPGTAQGIEAFKARKYAEARAIFQPVASRDPVAAYYMGRIAISENQLDRAVDHFEKAIQLDGRNAEYYDWLGRAYGSKAQKANKLKLPLLARKTRMAWEKGLSIDPDNIDIMEGLVQYYLQAPGFLGGSKDKAGAMILEVKKRNGYRGSILAANICGSQKDSVCAEREIRGMITAYPDSTAGYVSLAAFHANAKRFEQAFDVIDGRLRQKPNDVQIQYALGRTSALSGQHLDRGEQALKNYIAHPPENALLSGAHLRLGMIYARKGDRALARKHYITALQINPGSDEAKKELAALGS